MLRIEERYCDNTFTFEYIITHTFVELLDAE